MTRARTAGFTLIELTLSVAITAILVLAIGGVAEQARQARELARLRNARVQEARFAMERMVRAVSRTSRLLLPLVDSPKTAWDESQRDLLAVALDPELDRDDDGVADADNDGDGLVDEDWLLDNTNDGMPGIIGLDDDGDGSVDEGGDSRDNDEDGAVGEDFIDGSDNDGDGSIDEDVRADMNADGRSGVAGVDDDGDGSIDEGSPPDDDEDGSSNEDGLDAVVYRLSGSTLLERLPDLNPVDGTDFSEYVLAENVVLFAVRRLPRTAGARAELVELALELAGPEGETIPLTTRVRVGEGR